ncbi:hypothetical protein ES705_27269 [subsurface metagenome]
MRSEPVPEGTEPHPTPHPRRSARPHAPWALFLTHLTISFFVLDLYSVDFTPPSQGSSSSTPPPRKRSRPPVVPYHGGGAPVGLFITGTIVSSSGGAPGAASRPVAIVPLAPACRRRGCHRPRRSPSRPAHRPRSAAGGCIPALPHARHPTP